MAEPQETYTPTVIGTAKPAPTTGYLEVVVGPVTQTTDVFTLKKGLPLKFNADKRIGVGRHGQVVVADQDSRILNLYQQQDDWRYKEVWSKPLPPGFTPGCCKRVYDTGEILLQESEDGETQLFDQNLEHRATWTQPGLLIGNLSAVTIKAGTVLPERPVYKVWLEPEHLRAVHIMQDTSEPAGRGLLLKLDAKHHKWDGQLSVCESGKHKRIAVLDSYHRTVDLFDCAGKYVGRIGDLAAGIDEDGVCCTDDYIFVSCRYQAALYIFNWSGQRLACQLKSQLGLGAASVISFIQYNPRDKVLLMAVGQNNLGFGLNTYRINFARLGQLRPSAKRFPDS